MIGLELRDHRQDVELSETARIANEKRRHGAPPETMGQPATAQRSPTAIFAAISHFTRDRRAESRSLLGSQIYVGGRGGDVGHF